MKLQWNGNLDDDCSSKTNDGYFAHVECMGSNTWYFSITKDKESVYHSTEEGISVATGDAARKIVLVFGNFLEFGGNDDPRKRGIPQRRSTRRTSSNILC